MSGLDLLIIITVFTFAVKGIFKGAIREVIGLLVLFIALFMAPIFAENAGAFCTREFNLSVGKDSFYFLGYFVIVLFSVIIGGITGFLINLILKLTGLSLIDRLGGFFIGALKAILIITLFLTIGFKMDITKQYLEKHVENSRFSERILSFGDLIMMNVEEAKGKAIENKDEIEDTTANVTKSVLENKHINEIKRVVTDKKNQDAFIKKIDDTMVEGINVLEDNLPSDKK